MSPGARPPPAFEEVWRDPHLLVVHKPAGLPTQRTRAGEPGLFEALQAQERSVFLHHRLDRNTSGLLVFALHPDANPGLARALREHAVQRSYRAVLEGEVGSGTWSRPVEGRPARTEVRVRAVADGLCEVECALHTGRKHQIRVHAALAGAPVVGDRTYGGDQCRPWPRLALHGWRLALTHPIHGTPLAFEREPPAGWAPAVER